MKYLIHRGGQQYGPYSVEELRQFVASGNILSSDMAWAQGMPAWVSVSQILGGAPAGAAAPAPAPAPAPSYQAPGPAFAQPPTAAPASYAPASYASPVPSGGPMPPSMHWALVLVISIFCGVFGLVWMFVQASFVKKLDPNNKSIMMFIVSFLVGIGGMIVMMVVGGAAVAMGARGQAALPFMFLLYPIVCLLPAVFGILGVFGMRRSLLYHYNTVEPIGLRLSGVMTFFFAIFYFQYHFMRIANWKQTGVLTP